MFYQLYFSVFNTYKQSFKQKAHSLALVYISLLQATLILLLGVFFSVFFKQLNVHVTSSNNAWTLFIIAVVINHIKNWIQFSGKKRNIMKAKAARQKISDYNIWMLWMLPIGITALSIILLQSFI